MKNRDKGIKIALSGKGGVGKTTLSALLVKALVETGKKVLAIDADPSVNLAQALGFSDTGTLTPMAKMRELIQERTESNLEGNGFFKLNPKVHDLPERFSLQAGDLKLMILGGIQKGGSGCICPESTLLKNLVNHLVLERDEAVILDMEAGLEHLGRGTAAAVDGLIVVVDPSRRSRETALRIRGLANDLGLKRIGAIANKTRDQSEWALIRSGLPQFDFLGFLPYSERIMANERENRPVFENNPESVALVKTMISKWT